MRQNEYWMSILQSLVKQCLDQIETIKNGYGIACPYCGALTVGALPNEIVCNFCEAYFTKTQAIALKSAAKKMAALNRDAITGETKAIDAFAEEVKKQPPNPLALYGLGNLYWAASSSKYLNHDYNLAGFMEQNSDNTYASLAFISRAKEHFYKALDVIQHIDHTEDTTQLVYTTIICNLKLGRMLQAHTGLEVINKINVGGLARSYANMAYVVNARDPGAITSIKPLLNAGSPNAIYYLARVLAQKKQFDDALLILGALSKSVNMPMCSYLLRSIKGLKEKAAL